MTLSRQLVALLMVLVLVAFVGTFLISAQNTRTYMAEQLASDAQDAATSLGVSVSPYLATGDMATVTTMTDAIFERGDYEQVLIEEMDGTPLLERQTPVEVEGVPSWFIQYVAFNPPLRETLLTSGWTLSGRVKIRSNPGYAYAQLWQNLTGVLRWFLLSAAGMLLLGVVLLRSALRPLQESQEQANAICHREFPVLDKLPRTSELRSVVKAMNRMSRKVKRMLAESEYLATGLHRQAHQSLVTGLSNKRHFLDTLAYFIDSREEFSRGVLGLVQLNDFKAVNVKFGFQAGDELLRNTASLLQGVTEELPEAFLAHLGGADFALAVPEYTQQQGADLGARLSGTLGLLYGTDKLESPDVCHIGLAYFDGRQTPAELLSAADMALQTARGSQANGWHLSAPEGEVAQRPVRGASEWRSFLEQALAMDRILLQTQPVVSCPGRELLHHEVLVRVVEHTAEGEEILLPAGVFMPQAENAGLTAEIDRAVISRVLAGLAGDGEGHYAVNLSPSSLRTPGFVEWLDHQLRGHPEEASRIIFEMSEYGAVALMDDVRNLIELLERHGSQFSLDHFGRSFSSFAYLHSLKAHYLKVDGSYLRSLVDNQGSQFYLQALTKIAHGLEIKVIGESIESEGQWELLPSLNIDGAQGYFVGRPE